LVEHGEVAGIVEQPHFGVGNGRGEMVADGLPRLVAVSNAPHDQRGKAQLTQRAGDGQRVSIVECPQMRGELTATVGVGELGVEEDPMAPVTGAERRRAGEGAPQNPEWHLDSEDARRGRPTADQGNERRQGEFVTNIG